MRYKIILTAVFLLSVNSFSYAAPTEEAVNLQEAFVNVSREAGPAVVSISVEQVQKYRTRYSPFYGSEERFFEEFFGDFFIYGPEKEFRRQGLGSGVIISEEGYILTNEHVVHNADRITVTLADGREFEGYVTGSDEYSDLAVIKIEPRGDIPVAKLGDSDAVKIGHWAIAIGNPFAFAVRNPEPTVTVGVVSALQRSLPMTSRRTREYSDLIQTDASINPGNSGGPLVNINGEVIGINVAIFTLSGGSQGIGFAIPINAAKKIMDDLIKGRRVLHGWIGVIIQDLNMELAEYFGLDEGQGVMVARVLEGSPAERTGLKAGDVIISFDNKDVRNTQDLVRMIVKKEVGETGIVRVVRAGRQLSLEVEIRERPDERGYVQRERKTEKKRRGTSEIKYWRGIEATGITPEIEERFGIESDSGVIVIDVLPGSAADRAGIRKGDVIYEINRTPVRNLEEYRSVTGAVSGTVLLGTYRGYVVLNQ